MRLHLILLIAYLLFLPVVLSDTVEISIHESGSVINFFSQYYIYSISGTFTLTNNNSGVIDELYLPYSFSDLTFESSSSYALDDGFFFMDVAPYETVVVSYTLMGLSFSNFYDPNSSILEEYLDFDDIRVKGDLVLSLDKTKIIEISNTSYQRFVSVHIQNPSSFLYNLTRLEIIKTANLSLYSELDRWVLVDETNPRIITSYSNPLVTDDNPIEGEVYWVNAIFDFLSYNYTGTNAIDFNDFNALFDEGNSNQGGSGSGADSFPNQILDGLGEFDDTLLLVKQISQPIAYIGQPIDVRVIIFNMGYDGKTVDFYDTVPKGFRVISYNGSIINGNAVIGTYFVAPFSGRFVDYTVRLDESYFGLSYFPKAQAEFNGYTYYSKEVPFVYQYEGEYKVFLQKTVEFLDGGVFKVTLTLMNLGDYDISKLTLIEHVKDSLPYSYSQTPSGEGRWVVSNLESLDSVSITYLIDDAQSVYLLPTVLGIDDEYVYKSLTFSSLIPSIEVRSPFYGIELIGIIIVVMFAFYYGIWRHISRFIPHPVKKKPYVHLLSRQISLREFLRGELVKRKR